MFAYSVFRHVHSAVNRPSVLLLIEVCTLLTKCISYDGSIVEWIVRDRQMVHHIIAYLDVNLFGECFVYAIYGNFNRMDRLNPANVLENSAAIPNQMKHTCWTKIMKLLRHIADSANGFQIICEAYAEDNDMLLRTFVTLIHCFGHNGSCTRESYY